MQLIPAIDLMGGKIVRLTKEKLPKPTKPNSAPPCRRRNDGETKAQANYT
jgi:phosphoribosylformimino-5-aminoimidazole carboxamide ribonucleotide (ProFAR) isomerase